MENRKKNIDKKIEEKLKSSLLVIDKKAGVTSADEVYELRRIFKNKERSKKDKIKIGHSGTLDPKVTGVLVVGLGKGTKVLEYILLSKKVYETEIIFHEKVLRRDFVKALKYFTGVIFQLPPVKSSVKREEREREVYNLKLTSFAADGRSAQFVSSVEKGTYIRKLCHDIGESLGSGAHMGKLRRTQAGVFSFQNSMSIKTKKIKELYESEEKKEKEELLRYLYSLDHYFERLSESNIMKKVYVKKESEKYIRSGNAVRFKNIDQERTKKYFLKNNQKMVFSKDEVVSIFCEDEAIAVGKMYNDIENIFFDHDKPWEKGYLEEDVIISVQKVF